MNRNFVVTLALSTAFVAVPAMTASAAGMGSTAQESARKAMPHKAFLWAKKAEHDLAKGQHDRALGLAERAVGADLRNRDYRSLLARVYMAKGRFASAERALMDVMELGQIDPRTVISLALSRIAQGKVDSATNLLEANHSILPVSDYGLTLALAGRSADAIHVLTEAVRADSATSRTRQNLALAYALDGRWRDARIMASQDMSQDKVDERIAEWAQFARPGAHMLRVAGLLKVRPDMSDSGQPVALALSGSTPAGLAQAELGQVDGAKSTSVTELVAIGPAPTSESAGFAELGAAVKTAISNFTVVATEAPLIKASEGPAKKEVIAPAKAALADARGPRPATASGSHLVQLGAFSSTANALFAWNKYAKRFGILNGFQAEQSTVTVNGKTLIRLAAVGFGNAATAHTACSQIKAQGGTCFVRLLGGSQSVRMAHRNGRLLAAR